MQCEHLYDARILVVVKLIHPILATKNAPK